MMGKTIVRYAMRSFAPDPAHFRRQLAGLRRTQGLAVVAPRGLRRHPLDGGQVNEGYGPDSTTDQTDTLLNRVSRRSPLSVRIG